MDSTGLERGVAAGDSGFIMVVQRGGYYGSWTTGNNDEDEN